MRRTTFGMVLASGSPRRASSSPVGIKRGGRHSEHDGGLTTLSGVVSVYVSIVLSAVLSVALSAEVSTGSVGWGGGVREGAKGDSPSACSSEVISAHQWSSVVIRGH